MNNGIDMVKIIPYKNCRSVPLLFYGNICSFFVYCLLLIYPQPSYAETVDKILATINDEFITLADYRIFIRREGYPVKEENRVEEGILKRLIEERLILIEAKKRGIIATDREIEEMLKEISKERGVSLEEIINSLKIEGRDYKEVLRDRIISVKLIKDEIESKVVINDKEIENFYNEHKEHYRLEPEKVEIDAFFLSLPAEASVTEATDIKLKTLKVLKHLREGEDFESIARRYGEFRRLGRFEKGSLLQPLNNVAFSLKEGGISNPVWTDEGVYIIKVTKRIEPVYQSLQEVRNQIIKILHNNKMADIMNDWLKRLWEGASIGFR